MMDGVAVYGLSLLMLVLVYPVMRFVRSHGRRKLSSRESIGLILLAAITLIAIAVTFYFDYPRY